MRAFGFFTTTHFTATQIGNPERKPGSETQSGEERSQDDDHSARSPHNFLYAFTFSRNSVPVIASVFGVLSPVRCLLSPVSRDPNHIRARSKA